MIALQYSHFGDPSGVVAPRDVPKPQAGEGRMLVRMVRSPIHNHALATIRGVYGVRPELPAIGGSELLGIADGARVVCTAQGAWAEYALVQRTGLVPVPDAIPDDEACQLLAMPLSALVLLEELKLRPGDWIVQNAANGTVARILAREAAQRGINVIGLVRSESTAKELQDFGAPHVVVTKGDWTERVREIAGGAPIVRAIDSVAGAQSLQLESLLAEHGELVVFGGLGGEALRLDPGLTIAREIVVRGFWMNAWMRRQENAPKVAAAMKRVFELALVRELPLSTAGVYSLQDTQRALEAAQSPGRTGKVLFKP